MSHYRIGERDSEYPEWVVRDRKGRLELWESEKTRIFVVYLYLNVMQEDDYPFLYAIRRTENAARELLDTFSRILR